MLRPSPRQSPVSTRSRIAPALSAAAFFGAVLIAGCSGGSASDDESSPPSASPSTTEQLSAPAISLEIGGAEFETLGFSTLPADEDLTGPIIESLETYVYEATMAPLAEGRPADDIESLFLFSISEQAGPGGTDRGALTDDAVPAATDEIEITAEPVEISGLQNGLGGYILAAASIDYSVSTNVADGPLTIHRFGDFYFSPTDDGWIVSAYDLAVVRETEGATTRTSATARSDQGDP